MLLWAGACLGMAGQRPASVPVFVNGTQGYRCFRIPAIVRAPDGALLAFAEARRGNCDDFGDVSIVLRVSHDRGATWGAMSTVASNGSLQAGNPSPVVDALDRRYKKGRVLLIYETGDATENNVRQGSGERRVWMKTTSDDGASWSNAADITAETRLPSWRAYGTGPGHGLLLTSGSHAGRIVIGAYHSQGGPQPNGHDYAAHAIYSDDHGATWHIGASVAVPGSNESSAAQRADGAVVINSRDESGESLARVISISKDGGAHWDSSTVARDLPDPKCEGSMIAVGTGKKQRLLFSNADGGRLGVRRNLTVSVSRDGGLTWPKHTVLYAGPAAYSDLVIFGGRVGVLWESADEHGIVFLAEPLAPLLQVRMGSEDESAGSPLK
jgi:sialidase-1